jgi:hypothetical protein
MKNTHGFQRQRAAYSLWFNFILETIMILRDLLSKENLTEIAILIGKQIEMQNKVIAD